MNLSAEIRQEITRYLSYGWGWRIITSLINWQYETGYAPSELEKLYRTCE